jgi:hypothetical protein
LWCHDYATLEESGSGTFATRVARFNLAIAAPTGGKPLSPQQLYIFQQLVATKSRVVLYSRVFLDAQISTPVTYWAGWRREDFAKASTGPALCREHPAAKAPISGHAFGHRTSVLNGWRSGSGCWAGFMKEFE